MGSSLNILMQPMTKVLIEYCVILDYNTNFCVEGTKFTVV